MTVHCTRITGSLVHLPFPTIIAPVYPYHYDPIFFLLIFWSLLFDFGSLFCLSVKITYNAPFLLRDTWAILVNAGCSNVESGEHLRRGWQLSLHVAVLRSKWFDGVASLVEHTYGDDCV